jgi:hypothetical protein
VHSDVDDPLYTPYLDSRGRTDRPPYANFDTILEEQQFEAMLGKDDEELDHAE